MKRNGCVYSTQLIPFHPLSLIVRTATMVALPELVPPTRRNPADFDPGEGDQSPQLGHHRRESGSG